MDETETCETFHWAFHHREGNDHLDLEVAEPALGVHLAVQEDNSAQEGRGTEDILEVDRGIEVDRVDLRDLRGKRGLRRACAAVLRSWDVLRFQQGSHLGQYVRLGHTRQRQGQTQPAP